MNARISIRRAPLPVLALLAVGIGLAPSAALAKRAPSGDERGRTRINAVAPALAESEVLGPVRFDSGVQRRFGEESGLLRRYWRLTPGPAKAGGAAVDAKSAAESFLLANATALGIDASTIARTLTLASEKRTPSGTHVRWNQVVNGIPVYRGDIVVKVSNEGLVSSVQNNLGRAVAIQTRPTFDAARAVELGVAAIGPTGKPLGDYTAELNVVQFQSGPALAYRVSIPNEQPMGDWQVFVDARTGDVLGIEDRAIYATGSGQVFDPDPETKVGNPNLPDNNDADSGIPFPAAYDIRTLNDITNTAGIYSLSGPFAKNIEFEAPTSTLVTATDPDSFRFQRSAQAFEDVVCYFHIDNFQRYIQSLGFTNANNRVQEYDSHGLSGADNSHYIPSTKRIAYGEGGVDDGEDADVVIHEYGHSIQDNIVPGWGGGQEGAMGEGFGDYLAGSYSRALFPSYEPNFVFNWDGHNEFWPGRLLIDNTLHYPEDCCGEVHDAGTLWCSGLTDAWNVVGRAVMDRLVIDHHFALGTTATMQDAATQILQSDIDLYGGAHVGQLVTVFDAWGFVNAEDFLPVITHTPLTDTEDTTGPYVVSATITSVQPLDTGSLKVFHGTTGSFTDSLAMSPAGPPNEYTASIPGPLNNVDVRYYIVARDVNGGTATHPVGAPGSFHQFRVGADQTAPVITHTPLGNTARIAWPAIVNATVTDNMGVNPDSVRVNWSINATPRSPFYLARVGVTNNYTGPFPSDTTEVVVGDVVTYAIVARDVAALPNIAISPNRGTYAFDIIASRGTVLVLDDDELAAHQTIKALDPTDVPKGGSPTVREDIKTPPTDEIQSASSIASILNTLGFTATIEPAATSNPATWSGYQLLISSSGANESPVADATYRSNLEAYVAAGGKLLVEGGEVAYDATTSPIYPTFAANIVHSNDWDGDNAGALQKLAGQSGHPIANVPNVLPSTLPVTYVSYGSQDSYKPVAPAYIVYGVTAQAGNGGILVYDNTPSPQSAQIVVWGFDFKAVADLDTRGKLLENTAVYLLSPESAPTGSITGRVQVAGVGATHAGVTVQISPGGNSIVTDSTGYYTIPNLYAANYTVTASKTGYATSSRNVAVGAGVSSGIDFIMYPQVSSTDCLSPATAIPDNNPTGIQSNLALVTPWVVKEVGASVNISHTYIGDLIVELRHGAKTVRLHNRTGSSADNIVRTYPPTTVDGPGALTDFIDDPSAGTWTLFVSDNAGLDTGTLNNWCLYLKGPADSSAVVVGVEDGVLRAGLAWLAPGEPNPMRGAGSNIRYALALAGPASLVVYDVAGRKVRTLLNGWSTAGVHSARWDGRDDAGRPVNAGVYLYRLRAGTFDSTQRMIVMH